MKRIINWFRMGAGMIGKNVIGDGSIGVATVFYDLRWTGTGAHNQPFTNTQVIDTAAEGIQDGSLTVVKTGGGGSSVEVVDGKLELVGDGADFEKTALIGEAVIKVLGKALFYTQGADASLSSRVGFNESAETDNTPDPWYFERIGTLYRFDTHLTPVATIATTQTQEILFLLGSFDTNEIPFKIGDTVADFDFGCRVFMRGGNFTNWTLLWLSSFDDTSTLYPQFNMFDAVDKMTLDNIYIPTNPLSPSIMFQPKYLATFTGTNGTQIVAYDPEVGGRLESGGITWTIQDDKAVNDPGLGSEGVGAGDCLNNSYDTFDGASPTGFHAIHSTTGTLIARTAQQITWVAGDIYEVSLTATLTSGQAPFVVPAIGGTPINSGAGNYTLTAGANKFYFIADTASVGGSLQFFNNSNAEYTIADISVKAVTRNEIFATRDLGITQGIFDVPITIPTVNDGFAGLVLSLNSVNSPTDYIEVFYNRGTGKVEVAKFVAGSRTSLINETTTYVAGKQLRAILTYISATDDLKLRVYYNGALVGTEQTIEDNSIAGNTRHGIMSVDASSTIALLVVHSLTDSSWDAEISAKTGGAY